MNWSGPSGDGREEHLLYSQRAGDSPLELVAASFAGADWASCRSREEKAAQISDKSGDDVG